MAQRRKLRPVLDGRWWLIGPSPLLSDRIQGDESHRVAFEKHRVGEHNAPVDHHVLRDDRGVFHLWGCVRSTAVGRILYHWQSDDITASPWRDTGQFLRADRDAGESVDDWHGEEWLQSPFFVRHDDGYSMFYGGHRAGLDASGTPVEGVAGPDYAADPSLHQICLMTSSDGRSWKRHRNSDGTSRLFLGPGETRDPCVIRVGDRWHMYCAGYFDPDRPDEGAGFVVRTSTDLVNWSDWRLVHRGPSFGADRCDTECPFVVEKGGFYYLFRTVDYYRAVTLVFRSEDPFDFGVGDARGKFVGRLPCAAPELYEFDGIEYVSSSHAPLECEKMCRIRWVEDE